MPYQTAAEDSSKGVVALQHDGDTASTQLLKKQDDQKQATRQSLFSSAVSGVYQNDGTEWLFFFNSFNQIIYRWTPPNSPAQVLTLTVLRSPINGNPFSISAVVLDNLPWVFYLSIFDILSDVRLRATPGHEFERGTLASLNLRASAQSPIYATTTNQSEHRIVVWYIPFDSNGEWASASLDSENRWTRNT